MNRLVLAIAALVAMCGLARAQYPTPQFNSLGVGVAAPSGTGNMDVSGQYQVNGLQINAGNLSNGTTGTGAVVLGSGNPAITLGNGTGLPPSGIASIGSGHLIANAGASSASPADTTATSWLDRAFCSTVGYVVARATSTWICSQGIPANVTWFGAVGDGSTDNTTVVQNLVNQLITSYGGGTILFPPAASSYCIFSGISVTHSGTVDDIHFVGSGIYSTAISACGHDATLFNLNTQWSSIANMAIYGYGSLSTDPVFTTLPTNSTVMLSSGCSFCRLDNVYVTGGLDNIQLLDSNYVLDNVATRGAYGDTTHHFAMLYTNGGGGWIANSHFDQIWPFSVPAYGASINAWAATTAYTAGAVVSVTCLSRSWWWQAMTSGTSAASQPACQPYGNTITDGVGGLTWQLIGPTNYACAQIDTGSIETYITTSDFTCAANNNIQFSNTYSGTAPQQITLQNVSPGGGVSSNVAVSAGSHIRLFGIEASRCIQSNCTAIALASSGAYFNLANFECLNTVGYCVFVSAGSASNIHGGIVTTSQTGGIYVGGGISTFNIDDNLVNVGAGNSIYVAAGASNHYTIQGNSCNGTAMSDNGTGANKLVQASCP